MAAPIALTCVRHQCPFCRRTWAVKSAAARHVARCWANPDVRSCKTCAHFIKAWRWDGIGSYDQDEPAACSEGISWDPQMPTQCQSWSATPARPDREVTE